MDIIGVKNPTYLEERNTYRNYNDECYFFVVLNLFKLEEYEEKNEAINVSFP